MKWPESPDLPEGVRQRLDERIARFLDEDASPDGAGDSASVRQLIDDLAVIYSSDNHTSSLEVAARLSETVRDWDTEDPRLIHIEKYIKRLFGDRPDSAHGYLDKALKARADDAAEAGKQALASAGSKGGQKRHELEKIAIADAMRYYHAHRAKFESNKAAARELERLFPPVAFATYRRLLTKE